MLHESAGADVSSETKKVRVINVFCCLLLALASKKERKRQWIIVHVLNFILSKFLPFSIHSSCWMQDAKSGRNIRLSKVSLIREHH